MSDPSGSCGKMQVILWHTLPECLVLKYEECRILFYLELYQDLNRHFRKKYITDSKAA